MKKAKETMDFSESIGFCHPSNAVRTKCACGRVIGLGQSVDDNPPIITCACGRQHRKAPGGWRGPFRAGKRRGGKDGCPGLKIAKGRRT